MLWGGVVAFVPCGVLLFPGTVATFAALAAALAVWPRVRRRARYFPPLAAAAVAAAYAAVVGGLVAPDLREYDRLRALHPLESMEGRLPAPAAGVRPPADAEFDDEVDTVAHAARYRARALADLHGDTTRLFVNAPGFGVGRVSSALPRPNDWRLRPEPRDPTPPQPGSDAPHQAGRKDDAGTTAALHRAGVLDFVNPDGFGYVRDRGHVAGFQPHGFTRVPGPTVRSRVERVELVSLLLHAEPAVYVSDKLPEMTAVRTVPTRPLDDFEAEALVSLRAGGDLFERDDRTPARLMGSLRNGGRCVGCHGGERGDLLGAFSYTLRAR